VLFLISSNRQRMWYYCCAFHYNGTRNTLDWGQYYSSRIVFSHIRIEFGQTGNSAIWSADPVNHTLEPNMKWIGQPLADYGHLKFSQMWWGGRSVGRSSVGPQYILLLTLISYTRLRYVFSLRPNVAKTSKKWNKDCHGAKAADEPGPAVL